MSHGDAFFSFRFDSKNDDDHTQETLVIFAGLPTYSPQGLAQAVEHSLKGKLLPDYVVFLCGLYDFSRLSTAAREDTDFSTAIERGKTIKSFILAAYDKTGEIKKQKILRGTYPGKLSTHHIAQFGMKALYEKNIATILVRAKNGFLFAKPSSRRSNYFIRAEGLTLELADTSFVAFYLLRFLNEWVATNKRPPESIYIDSMSIATIAMALIEMRRRLDDQFNYPRVTSFHSYEGLAIMPTPPRKSSICIISASTSSNLACEWKKKMGTSGEEVITLLSLVQSQVNNKVAFTITMPKDYFSLPVSDDHSGLRLIRVSGEHFWVEAFPSRSVLLTKKSHCPDKLPMDMEVFVSSGAMECRRVPKKSDFVRAMHADGCKLITNQSFGTWISKVIDQQIPTSIRRIIYQEDEASKTLAQQLQSQISQNNSVQNDIILQSDNELAQNDDQWHGSVAIVAAVIGKGSRLLSISRDLRDRQLTGARIYIIGAAISPTTKTTEDLIRNLTYSTIKDRYEVHIFRPLSVGLDANLDSWDSECRVLNEVLVKHKNSFLEERKSVLNGTGRGLKDNVFLLSSCSNAPLALRDEFAFWDFKYIGKRTQPSQADVFLTICRILQHARESERISHDERLSSEVFQHVVLSPDCFSRFNDGVIQAALLRGCLRSETDYRGDTSLSEQMGNICLRIVQSYKTERGEASAEFLMALAGGRLQLESRAMDNLLLALGKDHSYKNFPDYFQILLSKETLI